MPIYEFRCLTCDECFELLVMNSGDAVEMCCPACESDTFERVLSTTARHVTGASAGGGVSSRTRSCSGGSCTTYDIPGPAG